MYVSIQFPSLYFIHVTILHTISGVMCVVATSLASCLYIVKLHLQCSFVYVHVAIATPYPAS